MELRAQEEDALRASLHSNNGFVERRNNNTYGPSLNGSKTPPPVFAAPSVEQKQKHHSASGSTLKRPPERYCECLRNHAASVGGTVYDGCREFMAAGEDGTLEAFKCAACECHRNFHRKETERDHFNTSIRSSNLTPNGVNATAPVVPGVQFAALSYHMHPHHYHHQRYSAAVQPLSVAYGGGNGVENESSTEEVHVRNSMDRHGGPPLPPYVLSRKRFRTKFSMEQKERMMEFAEKIGWRMNRPEEGEVERFCRDVGIRRQVFKVWMHNNKNMRKTDDAVTEHVSFQQNS